MRNPDSQNDFSFCFQFVPLIRGISLFLAALLCAVLLFASALANDDLSPSELELVKSFEQHRVSAINQVIGSVVAIYDEDRKGGGSGVIIDASGLALTNHHVIVGAGIEGWGGLADGESVSYTHLTLPTICSV